jgi:glucose/arabinose dehydrogenase
VDHKVFVSGFLGGKRGDPKATQPSWGRPADVQQLPDGSLLISDDGAHTVYRLHYKG